MATIRCKMLWFIVLVSFCSIVFGKDTVFQSSNEAIIDSQGNNKHLRICSISGGLDITRLKSKGVQNIFLGALEDVEFIREYISEAALNQGISGGLHDLEQLSYTLDWAARNMSSLETTLSAGLGYVDDRVNRKLERYVGATNQPYTGSKSLDMALIDSASNIYPWLVDRRSEESSWWFPHQNGRLVNGTSTGFCQRLYVAAWIGTKGEAWMYYPPISKTAGRGYGFGDILGSDYDSSEEAFIKPNLPENNPERIAYLTKPYSDTAVAGLSLITAQAPIYFTGDFRGTTYDDVYIASAGVDISMASISSFLQELEGTVTANSFAFVVNSQSFDMIIISEETVQKIYPARTGFEEERVSRSKVDGSILSDRRNQTYLPADTLFQRPTELGNADWSVLAKSVRDAGPGQRSWSTIDIVLSGDTEATSFYVMYEKWDSVADWTMLVFAPIEEVDTALQVTVGENTVDLVARPGESSRGVTRFSNTGTLDACIQVTNLPSWLTLSTDIGEGATLGIGESIVLEYEVNADEARMMDSSLSSFIAVTVVDENYPDCFYQEVIAVVVNVQVLDDPKYNYLTRIRPYGLVLASISMLSAVGWSIWVLRHKHFRVVRASQPVFLHMMCAGIFLMSASIIPMAIDDSIASIRGCSIACMSIPWLLAMGFSITFSALFSKIWRINQIVQACLNLQRVKVSARDVIIPFLAIFSLNTVILTLWSVLAPIVWVREEVAGQGSESVGYCSLNDSKASLVFGLLLVLLNFFALVLALIQLYKARELSTEYSEGKYISIAIGSMVQVFMTGFPLLILVQQNPHATYFVKSTVVFVVSMSLLLLTFLPKYFILRQELSKDRRQSSTGKASEQKSIPSKLEVRRTPSNAISKRSEGSKSQRSLQLEGASLEVASESHVGSLDEGETLSTLSRRSLDEEEIPSTSCLTTAVYPSIKCRREGFKEREDFRDEQLISDVSDSLFTISETEAIVSCKDEDFISMFSDEDFPRDSESLATFCSGGAVASAVGANVPLSSPQEPCQPTPHSVLEPNLRSVFALHANTPPLDTSPALPNRKLLSPVRRHHRPTFSREGRDNNSLDSLPRIPAREVSEIEYVAHHETFDNLL